jgi:hypothetical protein
LPLTLAVCFPALARRVVGLLETLPVSYLFAGVKSNPSLKLRLAALHLV